MEFSEGTPFQVRVFRWLLLGSLPCGFNRTARRINRVAVLQFVRGERCDQSLLIDPDKIREGTPLNVCYYGFVGFIDCIRAKTTDKSCHDSFIFRGSSLGHRLTREFGKIGARDEKCKMTVPIEQVFKFTPSLLPSFLIVRINAVSVQARSWWENLGGTAPFDFLTLNRKIGQQYCLIHVNDSSAASSSSYIKH
jgi:hypothetical protein